MVLHQRKKTKWKMNVCKISNGKTGFFHSQLWTNDDKWSDWEKDGKKENEWMKEWIAHSNDLFEQYILFYFILFKSMNHW